MHCRISGCTDHYAETEEEAMETTKHIIASLNLKVNSEGNRTPTGDNNATSYIKEVFL